MGPRGEFFLVDIVGVNRMDLRSCVKRDTQWLCEDFYLE